jgi:hypothetical protein
MRCYYENIVVHIDERGLPQRVIWRNRLYRVISVEEQWRYAGKWWLDFKGWQRHYFRATVRAAQTTTQYEIQLYKQGSLWTLCGVYD